MTLKMILFIPVLLSLSSSVVASPKKEVILILGDSLTEGYGISKEKAFPKLVEQILTREGRNVEVINGGISGSTTSSGASRLKWFLKRKPNTVVLALGANDGLRGTSVEETRKNLRQMIEMAKSAHAEVVLAGMQLPPNYGAKQAKAFSEVYTDLEREFKVKRIPFFLEGVAGVKELNQEDGIHPNEKGHEKIAVIIAKALK
jgi:acyl-CoA thioesterase I